MSVSILNATAVSMHRDSDCTVVVKWLKGRRTDALRWGMCMNIEGVNLRFSDSCLPKQPNENIFILFFIVPTQ